jgi:hypothetical protein
VLDSIEKEVWLFVGDGNLLNGCGSYDDGWKSGGGLEDLAGELYSF